MSKNITETFGRESILPVYFRNKLKIKMYKYKTILNT